MDRALRITRSSGPKTKRCGCCSPGSKTPVLSGAVEELLDRRHVALPAVASFVKRQAAAVRRRRRPTRFLRGCARVIDSSPHRSALLDDGPRTRRSSAGCTPIWRRSGSFSAEADLARVQHLRRRVERYFLTKKGDAAQEGAACTQSRTAARRSPDAGRTRTPWPRWRRRSPRRSSRSNPRSTACSRAACCGCCRLPRGSTRSLLEEHALLDFAGMLDKSVDLLSRQEEFARSRLKLQSRYHHVLVDEFQDTSRLQWRLIELLVDAWGEGEGVADAPTSIFVVGDRKQSIYRFRHAEVTLLDEAARKISALRPGRVVRQAITTSFRAVPELLAFVNALSEAIQSDQTLPERFTLHRQRSVSGAGVQPGALRDGAPVLGLVAEPTMAWCASAVAAEVQRLIGTRDGPRPRTGRRGRPAPMTSRSCFARAPDISSLRTRSRRAASGPTSTRASASSTRPKCRTFRRCCACSRSRSRICGPPSSCDRGSCGCPTLRSCTWRRICRGALGCAAGRRHRSARSPRRRSTARCSMRPGPGSRGGAAWPNSVPPSEVVDTVLSRVGVCLRDARPPARARRARTSRRCAALVRRVESRGYATLQSHRRVLRDAARRRRIERDSRGVRLREPDDDARREGPGVSDRVPRESSGAGPRTQRRIHDHRTRPVGEPEVAFTSNDATKLEDNRDAEELRRLLYVGVTRARDRLYFSAELDPRGQLRRSARSLASLLPSSFTAIFAEAAASPDRDRVSWVTPAGTFDFAICRASDAPAVSDGARRRACADRRLAHRAVARARPGEASTGPRDDDRSVCSAPSSTGSFNGRSIPALPSTPFSETRPIW